MNRLRTTILGLACATSFGAAAMLPAHADEPDAFKIGAVISFSGPYGIIGEGMKRGAELAIEHRGGTVLGKPIEVTWEDSETKPQPAVQKASRLLANGAHMIFGAVSSASTVALQGLTDQRKVPLLVTISADDRITRPNGSRYTFRTSNTLGMEMRMALEFTKARGLKKIYGVGADYAVTREGWDFYRAEAEKMGVEIVGIDYPPLGNRDYSVIIDKISKTDAEGVILVVTGSDGVTFLKQAGQAGLGKDKLLFGPVLQDELLAAAVGPAAIGANSGVRYHFSYDSPANRKFVEAYRAKYGEWPNSFAGEAYDGMSWFLDVVDGTKSWDKEKWVDAFAGSTRENSVEGTKVMRACDHQAMQVGLWGVVEKGEAPLPELTMKITDVFQPEALFPPCAE
ncbi:ABC transporter substrate-binding protein [Oceanibacterium hippocampi]|uniref:Leucine-, isoleucine-, valine-, threonine-, and alanine-binding protein n=1 Tax=Oceanibacterium hippocampi TaxID=745714 RepID=A0A1Y5RRL8_9PROT|nr:ABC transporter substrate-binding protein [Oceanibacterium hippocampi]SLN23756.1 Leucine-, isoleucine-, valine-, threonine-, and alanine-binding protein precursor [Oceanibacterium hippocampi]